MELSNTVELCAVVVVIISASAYCVVKITAQLEQSRCSHIQTPCCNIIRNLDTEAALVEISHPVAGAPRQNSTARCCAG